MRNSISQNNMTIKDSDAIFDGLGTGVIIYDANGHFVDANAMAWGVIPYLGTHLHHFSDFIHFVYDSSTEFSDQNSLAFPKRIDAAKSFYEVICINHDEFYLVRATQQINQSMIVEIADISHIKAVTDTMRSLNRNNTILTEAIQSSNKGIFVAENFGERRIVFANRALDTLLGRNDTSLMGYSLHAFLSVQFADDWAAIETIINHRQKGVFWRKIHRNEVNQQWLRLNLSADNMTEAGNLIIGFVTDETQAKLQEGHLIQTQKLEAIGKLAGGVAHDFNNILSIVEGYIRLSEIALKRGEDISGNIDRIKQAIARGSGLTKQLLTFGKHRVSDNKIINLCQQVKEMESLLKPLLGANIYLDIIVPNDILAIKATPDSVSQIVMNLVINARDAMPRGGEITLSVEKIEGDGIKPSVVLKVNDTGSGIPPDIIAKIFDPFFTTKEQGKGTGLGLSMVYGLVQQLGGTIDVASVVGMGTNFIVTFPLIDDAVSALTLGPQHCDGHGLKGKTILVAEDEQDLLVIMESTLADFGMTVLKARNGDEAIVLQDSYEGKIDFMLTDMVMPEMGGLKLAELMREVRPETHIVFMSGYPVRGEIADVNLPQDAIFMAKPVKPDFLKNVLEQISSGKPVDNSDAALWHA